MLNKIFERTEGTEQAQRKLAIEIFITAMLLIVAIQRNKELFG